MQNELRTIYIDDLSLLCSDMDIADAFFRCMSVINFHVKNYSGKDGKRYTLVTFYDQQSALNACLLLDGMFFCGDVLR
jgi:RNA recognition motif-containing protein